MCYFMWQHICHGMLETNVAVTLLLFWLSNFFTQVWFKPLTSPPYQLKSWASSIESVSPHLIGGMQHCKFTTFIFVVLDNVLHLKLQHKDCYTGVLNESSEHAVVEFNLSLLMTTVLFFCFFLSRFLLVGGIDTTQLFSDCVVDRVAMIFFKTLDLCIHRKAHA